MKLRTTSIVGALILALAVLGLYWLLMPQPVLVETAEVETSHFQDTIEEDGRTRVRDRYLVSAPLSGRVQRLALEAGDFVQTGQKLATITPPVSPLLDPRVRLELEAQVGAAEASVEEAELLYEQAKVLLAQARADLDRTQKLAKAKHRSRRAIAAGGIPDAGGGAAGHCHGTPLACCDPCSGAGSCGLEVRRQFRLGRKLSCAVTHRRACSESVQESENVVSQGSPLVELGDPGDLEIAVDVLTTDAARIVVGDKVIIERWGGPTELHGAVRRVEPSGFTKVSALGVEEQRVWIIADITSPRETWTGLGDGYRVEVKIVVDETAEATVLPIGALFRRGEEWNVFVVEEGRAHLREIQVARLSSRVAAIAQGVRPGEIVVVYPPSKLTDGSNVRLQ